MFSDSRLVVSQTEGSFEARDCHMSQYLKIFESLQVDFQKVSAARVPRSQNSHADSLATLVFSLDDCIPSIITVELLEQLSIEQQTVIVATPELGQVGQILTQSFYLTNPCQTISKKSRRCGEQQLVFGYPKMGGCTGSRLKDQTYCAFTPAKLPSCWLSFMKGYMAVPVGDLNPVLGPQPLAQQGLDIIGPFPRASGNRRYMVVAADYFTK